MTEIESLVKKGAKEPNYIENHNCVERREPLQGIMHYYRQFTDYILANVSQLVLPNTYI